MNYCPTVDLLCHPPQVERTHTREWYIERRALNTHQIVVRRTQQMRFRRFTCVRLIFWTVLAKLCRHTGHSYAAVRSSVAFKPKKSKRKLCYTRNDTHTHTHTHSHRNANAVVVAVAALWMSFSMERISGFTFGCARDYRGTHVLACVSVFVSVCSRVESSRSRKDYGQSTVLQPCNIDTATYETKTRQNWKHHFVNIYERIVKSYASDFCFSLAVLVSTIST